MKIYTALLRHDAEPVLVREGFSCGALILGPVWLAAYGAWIPAAISFAAYVLIWIFAPVPARWILLAGAAVILGLNGADLRRWSLERRGYLMLHVLAARGWDEAWMRLLTHRPDLAARFRPEPA